MIDPTKTAERQYDAIAKVVEEHGFVKDRIVTALRDVIAGEQEYHRRVVMAAAETLSPMRYRPVRSGGTIKVHDDGICITTSDGTVINTISADLDTIRAGIFKKETE